MSVDIREGGTRLDILAAISQFRLEQDTAPRQNQITDRVQVSKGAVSKTCSKLIDEGLLIKSDGRYRIDDDTLLEMYREHLEEFLIRETAIAPFQDLIEGHNEVRSQLKQEIPGIIKSSDGPRREVLLNILYEILRDSQDSREIQTHRDYLFAVDHMIRMTAAHIVSSPTFAGSESAEWDTIRPILQMAVVLNRGYSTLARLQIQSEAIQSFGPGEPLEVEMIRHLTN